MASRDTSLSKRNGDSKGRGGSGSDHPSGFSLPSISRGNSLPPTRVSHSRARRLAPWLAGTVSLLLILATLLIGWRVRESMRQVNRMSIETIRNTNLAMVELWLSGCADDAEAIVANEEVQAACLALLNQDLTANTAEVAATDDHRQRLSSVTFDRRDYRGWLLFDTNGKVLHSDDPQLMGKTLPIADDTQDRMDRSLSSVTRPFAWASDPRSRGKTDAQPGEQSPVMEPLMLAIEPIHEGVRSSGGFGLIIDPQDKFCDLFQAAQIGKSCETIAFDRSGVLITRSRFEEQLRRSGMMAPGKNVSSVLNVHARLPAKGAVDGGSSTVSFVADQVAGSPMTEDADQATRGATGSNVAGYRDYRGVKVIGTWCWSPRYNFGVVTKMDYDEAYGPMQILRNAFFLLLAVVALASLGLFALVGVIRRFTPSQRVVHRLGQYDLNEAVGSGGMGKVYRGRHESLQRDVAVKVLEHSAVNDHSFARFEREVRLTAKLRHPNTVDIFDFGRTENGTFFYVMEYVEGISLANLIDEHSRQCPARVIYILQQICASLQEAHTFGMVHRDIKPANILLSSPDGVCDLVKVLDFGLVKDIQHDDLQLTQFASITGTPLYMSPESVRDASKADARSDIYSLGAVGYHLLSGRPLFSDKLAADICAKQLNEQPIRPANQVAKQVADRAVDGSTSTEEKPTSDHAPERTDSDATESESAGDDGQFPDDLQNVLMDCLQKDPSLRPQSMLELADALKRCQHADRWTAADAKQWWENAAKRETQSPRDFATDFADNVTSTK